MEGYWSGRSVASSVDWCEPNYVVSPFVAEWWNTLSSFPIALGALLGLILLFVSGRRREPRFLVGYLVVFVVGLGSAAFHGTLSKLGQALDELPMVAAGLVFVYSVRFRRSPESPTPELLAVMRRWWGALGLYALLFGVAYFLIPAYFTLFILTYSGLILYLVLQTARVSFALAPRPDRRRWFLLAASSYVGGVLLLWVPENLILACEHPLQSLQLHAWFHLTSAFGSFAWLRWAVLDRVPELGGSERSRSSS
jgi:dihydroceramidase